MINPSEYPAIPDPLGYEEVECRRCNRLYPHPRSSNAGYGVCAGCFFEEFNASVEYAEKEIAKDPGAYFNLAPFLDTSLEPYLFEDE
jgi:hypothetical protein